MIISAYKCLKIKKSLYIPSGENVLYGRAYFGINLKKRRTKDGKIFPFLFSSPRKEIVLGKQRTYTIYANTQNESHEEYRIFHKKNFIKRYEVKKEEIDDYIEKIKNSRKSGYEPQFPKDAFRTPDGLTNVILDYKYKNDNLKIHNYYYFFLYFLKRLSEKARKKDGKNESEEGLISVQDLLFLKKKGFFEGDLYTWKNWIVLNKGEWKDHIGYDERRGEGSEVDGEESGEYDIRTLRPMVEPKMKRMPIEYWGSFRAIDFNVNHYPIYKKLFAFFNKVSVSGNEPNHKFYPFLFYPRFSVGRDRAGLGYGDANFFGNYSDIYKKRREREERLKMKQEEMKINGEDKYNEQEKYIEGKKENVVNSNIHRENFIGKYDFGPNDIKVEEATDIIKYPQNGRLYQKFYIGPLNITDGHTFGSLLKYVCQTQIYGYAIVAIKIHNMNEDTKINNVQEDLLEIALNLSDVCIHSNEVNIETNIRLIFRGPLMLVAGMIPLPSHLKIVNKEQYICTLKENGYIDISIKIEYGKGHWLTYEKGLYKRELGSDNECMKKREIAQVIDKKYIPITASFSSCRMVRITVHKIATKYWCEDRCEFTDPKQMLVVEIWSDCRMLPKNILLYGIKNIKKILRKFREMIINDNDFPCLEEEKEIKKLWPAIDRYKFLQTKQKMEGGPPINNIDGDLNEQMSKKNQLDPFTEMLVNPQNFPKHSNIMLPLQDTPPPFLDTLEWLKMEMKKDRNRKKRKEKKNANSSSNRRTFDYDDYLNDRLGDILEEK
ncbi:DNA-directed RNA polymerase, alpha subunit, putative [Plasmodium ovale]|uniref:DNA-directed RNA polymerase, alpha subunit, putative n=2 Tax=Plasmodium ovale TaxID=36330 RepID=A0A1A8W2R5_PLAOA|nr:DNA-directed RNA polymerase, alpha subunit, putative [Plasmodium ovale curtisi]SBS96646.1 DNA-directed RNA polymerase, alpha subunit, putative [Plasmodium ovale curtisi]SCP05555.1 DNA-directed RNA polymerase, alpha subunit, putative [Plasmodium ovale]